MSYKVIGINDEVTTCECCGRTNLKKTVVLSNGEGEIRYGTECAARAMGKAKKEVEKDVSTVEKNKAEAIAAEKRKADYEVEQTYYKWLEKVYGDRSSNMARRKVYRSWSEVG